MTTTNAQPEAVCQVREQTPARTVPWTAHFTSLMETIRAGGPVAVEPDYTAWITSEGLSLRLDTLDGTGLPVNVGYRYGKDTESVPAFEDDDHAKSLYRANGDFMLAARNGAPVVTGRRPDADGGHHGYLTWRRAGAANQPRIEISPDGAMTLWHHWPHGDAQPSDPT